METDNKKEHKQQSKAKRIVKRVVLGIFILFALAVGTYLWLLYFPHNPVVTRYALSVDFDNNKVVSEISQADVSDNDDRKLRIVQLTDLHNAVFGKENHKLVQLVEEQSPDIIIMTGDMINRDDPDLSVIKNLIEQLSAIAPVYFGYGNHERTWEQNYGKLLHSELSSAGAVVLDAEYEDITINGIDLRIGGFRGFYGFGHMDGQDETQKELDNQFFKEYADTDRYRILLDHIPTQWLDWHYIDEWTTGLVFCGHYHGGQIVLPFVGPLFAPYVGWFPEYTHGCYIGKTSTCILSSGLGNERSWLPRVNNPPEIVVTDLYQAE